MSTNNAPKTSISVKILSLEKLHVQFSSNFESTLIMSIGITQVFILFQIAQHCAIMKHVQTCSNIMIRFDTILQTCPDLFKYHDIYKHVQTCSNITIRFDRILQTCPLSTL